MCAEAHKFFWGSQVVHDWSEQWMYQDGSEDSISRIGRLCAQVECRLVGNVRGFIIWHNFVAIVRFLSTEWHFYTLISMISFVTFSWFALYTALGMKMLKGHILWLFSGTLFYVGSGAKKFTCFNAQTHHFFLILFIVLSLYSPSVSPSIPKYVFTCQNSCMVT